MSSPTPLPSFMRSLEVRKKINAMDATPAGDEKRKILTEFAENGVQSENKLPFLTTINAAHEEGLIDDSEWRAVFDPLAASFQQNLATGSVCATSHL
ncbi:hypothetical protein HDU93_007020 [Gonapodya sp. JEL0774]|nr:hypothetical protein HDU93_007020 [Gonapodya sp. JEL0774]